MLRKAAHKIKHGARRLREKVVEGPVRFVWNRLKRQVYRFKKTKDVA